MTRRNRRQSRTESRIVTILETWLETQPKPRGEVVSGQAGFRLSRDPDSTVGIDVAYVSAEVAAREPDAAYFEGPPVLAVEILSPSDTLEDIDEKVELSRDGRGARLGGSSPVPDGHRLSPRRRPAMFSGTQELTAEPHLPGFRVSVDRLFGF